MPQRPGEPKTSRRRIAAIDRQRQALELRKAGHDYETIGRLCGYASKAGAYKAVATALREVVREPAEELIHLEVRRLDVMLAGLWPKAITGDTWSVDRVLKIMERRATLLGLDAPKKIESTVELRHYAERVAADLNLDPREVIAQAEQMIAEAQA